MDESRPCLSVFVHDEVHWGDQFARICADDRVDKLSAPDHAPLLCAVVVLMFVCAAGTSGRATRASRDGLRASFSSAERSFS